MVKFEGVDRLILSHLPTPLEYAARLTQTLKGPEIWIRLKVKRCIPFEVFKKHGIPEMGLMFCESDFEATRAVNPKMKLIRTKMLSAGDDECNHLWIMED